jgi:hypothetical protein
MAISNNSTGLRPGVCTSSTRPTAPYEGQMIYETDTDLTYIWGGSAWQQVSGGTAVGNSGLVYIKSQTIGSGVSSVTVSSAFSADYDNYRIVVNNGVNSTNAVMQLALGSSTTAYYEILNYAGYSSATTPLSAGSNNAALFNYVGYCTASSLSASFDLINVFAAKNTQYHAAAWCALTAAGSSSGVHQVASSFTAFTLSPGSGTFTGGTITVYGYRKA